MYTDVQVEAEFLLMHFCNFQILFDRYFQTTEDGWCSRIIDFPPELPEVESVLKVIECERYVVVVYPHNQRSAYSSEDCQNMV